jgi:hypothetical protein
MTNETLIHPESLSDDQLDQLVRFLIDEFGVGLSGDELDESIGLVMENIPGFELVSTQTIHRLVNQIRSRYDDETRIHGNQD